MMNKSFQNAYLWWLLVQAQGPMTIQFALICSILWHTNSGLQALGSLHLNNIVVLTSYSIKHGRMHNFVRCVCLSSRLQGTHSASARLPSRFGPRLHTGIYGYNTLNPVGWSSMVSTTSAWKKMIENQPSKYMKEMKLFLFLSRGRFGKRGIVILAVIRTGLHQWRLAGASCLER